MLNKLFLPAAFTLLSASSALALTCKSDYSGTDGCASNATAAGDCQTLGYSTADVDGCGHYLYCPFDTSYKKCISNGETNMDCSDYTLTTCPANGICSVCGNGLDYARYDLVGCEEGYKLVTRRSPPSVTPVQVLKTCSACSSSARSDCPETAFRCTLCGGLYIIDSCIEGYTLSNNDCVVTDCTDYTLTSCPTGASSCSTCVDTSGSTLYKIDGCSDGYKVSGSTCTSKTCSDYGYSTQTTGTTYCNSRYSVQLGASTSYCYSNCATCPATVKSFCASCSGCYYYRSSYTVGYGTCYDIAPSTSTASNSIRCPTTGVPSTGGN